MDAEVRKIIRRYRTTKMLHPLVAEMHNVLEAECLFWGCLTHDLHVIQSRSQNLADGEITAAQKAFRILMDNKEHGVAAIELYVNEIIGLNVISEADRAQALATALQARDYILNRMSSLGFPIRPFTNSFANTMSTPTESQSGKNAFGSAVSSSGQMNVPRPEAHCTQSSKDTRACGNRLNSDNGSLFVSDGSETSESSDHDCTTLELEKNLKSHR